MFSTNEMNKSVVILSVNGKASEPFREGDIVSSGFKLEKINDKSITIDKGGKTKTIKYEIKTHAFR